MLMLIVEDDFTSRLLLQALLKDYGLCHIAVNGKEAVEAVRVALEGEEYYDLICLDIMMPEMDGQQALKEIRALEEARGFIPPDGAKIIMITALVDSDNVQEAIQAQCNYFLAKPFRKAKLQEALRKLGLIA
jgi:two-component system, chemotaxis family, chemotaxis protein CheY